MTLAGQVEISSADSSTQWKKGTHAPSLDGS